LVEPLPLELDGGEPPKRRVWPVGVVLDAPGLDNNSGFSQGCELLDVQQLVPAPAVEGFDEGVLPGAVGLDVERLGVAQAAPVPQDPGDELGAIVHAQVLRWAVENDEALQDVDQAICGDGTVDLHGEGLPGELVDDVGQHETAVGGRLVELEVDGPDVVGMRGPEPRRRLEADPAALSTDLGPAQALFAPQALDALSVDGPALTAQQLVGRLPAPAGVVVGDLAQASTELGFLGRGRPGPPSLGGAGLIEGGPSLSMIASRMATACWTLIRRAGEQARASLVNSSVTFRIFLPLPFRRRRSRWPRRGRDGWRARWGLCRCLRRRGQRLGTWRPRPSLAFVA